MPVENHKTGVPLAHYRERFAGTDPRLIAARLELPLTDGCFRLTLLGRPVRILLPSGDCVFEDGSIPGDYTQILLLRYLLDGSLAPSTGRLLSYRELPWGSVYTAQFDGRCTRRLAAYGTRLEAFKQACAALQGHSVCQGDVSYELPFLPGLTVRLTLWQPDDEFPAAAQFLFSDNFPAAFTAEDCAVIGDIILRALSGRW